MQSYIKCAFLVLIFFNLSAYAQQARVQKHFPRFDDKIDAAQFVCDDSARKQGMGVCEIKFLADDTLQIINHTPSPALGGISIKILLDTNLTVISITYEEWGDVMNAW